MKKAIKITIITAMLAIICAVTCSCGELREMFTSISVEVNASLGELTTDMTDEQLREFLTVRKSTLLVRNREITDYTLSCKKEEGYNTIRIGREGVFEYEVVTALFVNKDGLSREGDFLFCEIKGEEYLIGYTGSDRNIVFPERKPYIIFEKLFYENQNIDSIDLGNSVKQIGEYAFANSSIKSLNVGTGLKSIGQNAFDYCLSLEYLNVPSVEQWCLMGFDSVIPLNADKKYYTSSIGEQRFVSADEYHIGSFDMYRHAYGATRETHDRFAYYLFNSKNKMVHILPVAVSNPTYFTRSIHINGEKLTDLVIPESVTEVSLGFSCTDIESLTVHKNVSTMANGAFRECEQLESVSFEEFNIDLLNSYARIFDNEMKGLNRHDGLLYLGIGDNPYFVLVGVEDNDHTDIYVHEDTVAFAGYVMEFRARDSIYVYVKLSDSVEYVGENCILISGGRVTFIGGAGLRYIEMQEWQEYSSYYNIATVDIGDLSGWYCYKYPDYNKKTYMNEVELFTKYGFIYWTMYKESNGEND